jgi:hypothetical protein
MYEQIKWNNEMSAPLTSTEDGLRRKKDRKIEKRSKKENDHPMPCTVSLVIIIPNYCQNRYE